MTVPPSARTAGAALRATSTSTAAGDASVLALEQLVAYRLSLLAKLLERRLARLVGGEFGLAVAEYRVLAQIIMRPQSTVREIAARTLVDKAQVSRSVAALEEQRLVTRSIPTTDRRSPILTATRSGKALVRKIAPLRQAEEREILQGLTAEAVTQLRETLDLLFDKLVEPADDAAQPTAAQRRAALRQQRAGTPA